MQAKENESKMSAVVRQAITAAIDELAAMTPEEFRLALSELCHCGEPTTHGCHGVLDGKVLSAYFCQSCYNQRNDQ